MMADNVIQLPSMVRRTTSADCLDEAASAAAAALADYRGGQLTEAYVRAMEGFAQMARAVELLRRDVLAGTCARPLSSV